MQYAYILQSIPHPDRFYHGSTSDLKKRLETHNSGGNRSTEPYRPWRLAWYAGFPSKQLALDFERYLKNARTQPREFRPAEIQLLMPTLKGEWRAVFFLGLYTGQRLNDLCELKWCQLDLSRRTITFEAAKTGALVALPLHDSALDALVALPSSDRGDDPVFPRLAGLAKSSRSEVMSKAGRLAFDRLQSRRR